MFSSPSLVFDRTATLQRVPDITDDTDWGGDAKDVFVDLETDIACRVELGDTETWTIWMVTDNEPHFHDKILVDGLDLELYVKRSKPWTRLDGTAHHYELVAMETPTTRTFADAE